MTQYAVSDKQASSITPLYFGFDPYEKNKSFSIWLNVRYSMGTQGGVTPHFSSSSNTNVATAAYGSGSTVNPGTTTITARGDYFFTDPAGSQPGSIQTSASLNVIGLKILLGSTDVTNKTTNVIVGQQISLTAQREPSTISWTDRTWTIPGIRIKDYVANNTTGTVTPLTDLTGASITFYWVDGGDGRLVQYSCKVNGKSFSATTTFNVKRPTGQIHISGVGTIAVDNALGRLELHYGNLTTPGITFTRSITIPSGFDGDTQWVQIATPFRRIKAPDGWYRAQGTGLDAQYPYSSNNLVSDTPGQELKSTDLEAQVNDSFQMWLMFKPRNLANARWVPLRVVNWSWSATAVNNGGNWTLTSSSHSEGPTDSDSTTHPTWTQNASSIGFNKEQ